MKTYIKNFIPALCCIIAMQACDNTDTGEITPQGGMELVISPVVAGEETRAAKNYSTSDYFGIDDYGLADVIIDNVIVPYYYDAVKNELRAGDDDMPFIFPADGSPMTITVKWPTEAQRYDLSSTGVPKDQSGRETFMLSDYLSSTLKAFPVNKVMISLGHERSKAAFTLDGALYGKKIENLVVSGYTAYCDPALNDAQLIFMPAAGSTILALGCSGALQVEGDDRMYTFTLKESVTGFEPGSHHTVRIIVD